MKSITVLSITAAVALLAATTLAHAQVGPNEFAAFLGKSDTDFPQFVKARVGKTVKLTLRFNEKPHDYRGEPNLGLWEASAAGFFFDCNGSWDSKTGYAATGTLSGNWKIVGSKKLGGKTFYNLKCV